MFYFGSLICSNFQIQEEIGKSWLKHTVEVLCSSLPCKFWTLPHLYFGSILKILSVKLKIFTSKMYVPKFHENSMLLRVLIQLLILLTTCLWKWVTTFPSNVRSSWKFGKMVCWWISSTLQRGLVIFTVKVKISQTFIIYKANWNLCH